MNRSAGVCGRVLLFANTSWYLWNFRRRLAERLRADGYEVVWVAPLDNYSPLLEETGRFVPFPMDRKGRNPLAELATIWRVWRLLQLQRPEVVLTWTPKPNIYGALVGRLAGTPVIPNVAGLGYAFIGGGWLARIAGLLYRVALRKCPVVFFQNGHDRDLFAAVGWVREDAARVLPGSGVDLARFRPQPPRQGDDFVFLFVGRLLADKGLRELVEAVRGLKTSNARVRQRVVGFLDAGNPAGIRADELRSWEREGVVEYVGRTDEPETLMADADCVVLPSYYREGVPRALLEAAACARPVITTNTPGCRDAVIDGETGFLCEPRNIGSLASAMRRALSLSPAQRMAMGRAGRLFMERNFSEEVVLSAYECALSGMLGKTARTRDY